ncbi:hypothetical protein BpHYR1_030002 [Brachionus plicatilis]|uniref:Uncharacterized protein n=1 Tax=Brachionus plicatilis TaxID=10195 RepID=A0A3M7QU27_BRAPC|nr:hypothetical protein BpHYR1_030002 [Brachionus plicatilis]
MWQCLGARDRAIFSSFPKLSAQNPKATVLYEEATSGCEAPRKSSRILSASRESCKKFSCCPKSLYAMATLFMALAMFG